MPRKYSFHVNLQDVDHTLKIKPAALADKILSAAGQDADTLGFGVGELGRDRCTWVLSRLAVQTETMPRMGDELIIETWVSEYGRLLTTRNFTVSTPDGRDIGAAVSAWVMLNLESRTPMDLSRLENAVRATEHIPSPVEGPKRIRTEQMPAICRHTAAYSDIDFNGHVGTMRYIEMITDTLPLPLIEQTERLRMDINFLHETPIGRTIDICSVQQAPDFRFRLCDGQTDICRAELKLG